MKVILDTNFILTCVKQKIDLFSQLEDLLPGAEILIPQGAIEELVKLVQSRDLTAREREAASLALQILDKENITYLEFIERNVDDAIIAYARGDRGLVIATLDRGIVKRLPKHNFLTIRGRKRVDFA